MPQSVPGTLSNDWATNHWLQMAEGDFCLLCFIGAVDTLARNAC